MPTKYLYHATFAKNIPGIQRKGLVPNRGGSNFSPAYSGHSKDRVFMSSWKGFRFWFSKMEQVALQRTDHPIEDGYIPVALRIDTSGRGVGVDKVGSRDMSRGKSFYMQAESIPSSAIDVWEGDRWVPIRDVAYEDFVWQAEDAADVEYLDDLDPRTGEPEKVVWPDFDLFEPLKESNMKNHRIIKSIDSLLEQRLDEKMVVQGGKERLYYAHMVYEAYDVAKHGGSQLNKAYKALIESNAVLFKRMLSKIDVEFIDDYDDQGYTSANEMARRIMSSDKLVIDTRYSDNHSYFSPEENWIFRAVHDYYTHGLRGKDFEHAFNFDLKGELQTYNTHAKIAPKKALPALFCEVVAQLAHEIVTGSFPDPQKSSMLYGFDYINIGEIACTQGDSTGKYSIGVYDDNFPNGDAKAYLKKRGNNPRKALEAYEFFCNKQ